MFLLEMIAGWLAGWWLGELPNRRLPAGREPKLWFAEAEVRRRCRRAEIGYAALLVPAWLGGGAVTFILAAPFLEQRGVVALAFLAVTAIPGAVRAAVELWSGISVEHQGRGPCRFVLLEGDERLDVGVPRLLWAAGVWLGAMAARRWVLPAVAAWALSGQGLG